MIITLLTGEEVLVSPEDFEYLNQFHWYRKKGGNTIYVMRNIYVDDKRKAIFMHRDILKLRPQQFADHKNGNGLDNRRENLRIATHSQNMQNTTIAPHSSKYKGVRKLKYGWTARIRKANKCFYLGYFLKEEDAAQAYDKKAVELFGEFARPNKAVWS